MGKAFDLGLICGRFQHIHAGHEYMINAAFQLCDRVLITVGSAQESGTIRNPYDVKLRIELIETIYEDEVKSGKLIIQPLPDLSNENNLTPSWGKYLLENVRQMVGKNPDVMIYGNDDSRSLWFEKDDIKDISELILARCRIEISATKMRSFLVIDDFNNWMKYTNPKIWKYFDFLRSKLINLQETT